MNICLGCTKNGVVFSAASFKKDTIFGASQSNISPSYFVRALEVTCLEVFFVMSALKKMVQIRKKKIKVEC